MLSITSKPVSDGKDNDSKRITTRYTMFSNYTSTFKELNRGPFFFTITITTRKNGEQTTNFHKSPQNARGKIRNIKWQIGTKYLQGSKYCKTQRAKNVAIWCNLIILINVLYEKAR